MKTSPRLLIAALMAFSVASSFAQDTVVFNKDTGLVKQATFLPGSIVIINVAEGGGERTKS
jgi:hypothetical protein